MTNPKFASEAESRLEEREIEAAEAWLQSIDGDFEIEFDKFKIRMVDRYIEKMFFDRYVEEFEAADWWRIVNRKANRKNFSGTVKFSKFIIGLHSCPASSAGIERWFSTVWFIWSKTRNRLGMEKAQKLATCYRELWRKQVPHSNPRSKALQQDISDFDIDVEI